MAYSDIPRYANITTLFRITAGQANSGYHCLSVGGSGLAKVGSGPAGGWRKDGYAIYAWTDAPAASGTTNTALVRTTTTYNGGGAGGVNLAAIVWGIKPLRSNSAVNADEYAPELRWRSDVNSNTYYYFQLRSDGYQLGRANAGSRTTLTSGGSPAALIGQFNTVEIRHPAGNIINIYVNGNLVVSAFNDDGTIPGKAAQHNAAGYMVAAFKDQWGAVDDWRAEAAA